MNEQLPSEQNRNFDIAKWQAEYRECPKVFPVYVRDGRESDLVGLYDCREAAELHRDWYNAHNKNGYLGRATVGTHQVCTLKLAQERFR